MAGLFILSLGGSILLPALATAGTQRSWIIGGKEAAPHSWPFMASIQLGRQHDCGGFLVHPDWVLTAAHCMLHRSHFQMRVVLGAHDVEKQELSQQVFAIVESITHPHFNPDTMDNDIHLLRLHKPATLNQYVKLAHLPSPHADLEPGTICHVAGWGDISNNGDEPAVLMETSTSILKWKVCQTLWRRTISANTLCGASRRTMLQGVCAGDSGGPLLCQKKVYGIVSSSGKRCGDRRYPDRYTKLSSYVGWVQHIVQGHR
ncbi:PRS57 protease, partial [Bucco capensis]|nr:PRS57 protease [Bucco capensis]